MKKCRAFPGFGPDTACPDADSSRVRTSSIKTIIASLSAGLSIICGQATAQNPLPSRAAETMVAVPPIVGDDPQSLQLPRLLEETQGAQPVSGQDESPLVPLPSGPESAGQSTGLIPSIPRQKRPSPATGTVDTMPIIGESLQPSPIAEKVKQRATLGNDEQDLRPLLAPEQLERERPVLLQEAPGLQPSPAARKSTSKQASLLLNIEGRHQSPGTGPVIGATKRGILDYDTPNFRLGLTGIGFRAGLDFEYNDNVNAADRHLKGDNAPKSDFFIRPRFGIDAFIPISEMNVLTLRVDAGYEFSLNDSRPNASPFTISPDSTLAFDIFVGEVRINVHDRFGIENNAGSRSSVSNANDYTLFTNTAGLYVLWDVRDIKLSGGYDYVISRFSGAFDGERDHDSHILFGSASLQMFDLWTVGLETSFIHSTSGNRFRSTQNSLAIGPFVRLQLTPHTVVQAAIGYQLFDTTSTRVRRRDSQNDEPFDSFTDLEDIGGSEHSVDNLLYWNLSISNRLNNWFAHALSAGHERELGIGADSIDIDFIRYRAIWLLFPRLAVQLTTGLEHLKQQELGQEERSTWWTIGIGAEYKLTPSLRLGARYRFTVKSSDRAFRDYEQNRVAVGISYDF